MVMRHGGRSEENPTSFWTSLAYSMFFSRTCRVFRANFGLSIEVTQFIWVRLHRTYPSADPLHLLWALYFLKSKSTWSQAAAHCRASIETFKKHVKEVLSELDETLPEFSCEERFLSGHT